MSYSSVLIKLSGELLGDDGACFVPERIAAVASALARVHAMGVRLGVVVGGGNIFRGREVGKGHSRADVDQIGMLATVMNVGMLRFYLEDHGLSVRVMASRPVPPVAEVFDRRAAVAAQEAGEIVLLGGGTGNPFFTTDSAAALRAIELGADALFKGTLVDGVYDKDPRKHGDAVLLPRLTFDEVLRRNLQVMDQTAFALCRDRDMKVVVFNMTDPGNLARVVEGSLTGTVVTSAG